MNRDNAPNLSLIIPCYNEARRLPRTISMLRRWAGEFRHPIEVVLVVEPSVDGTLALASSLQDDDRISFVVIPHERRLGKGGAVRTGMLRARAPVAGFMDADGATDLSFFTEAHERVAGGHADVVIASRYLPQSVITTPQPPLRQLSSALFRLLTRAVLRLPFSDTQCGAKVFRREVIPSLFGNLKEYGFAFDVEVLLKAVQNGLRIEERPCIWTDRSGSTVRALPDGIKMARRIWALRGR